MLLIFKDKNGEELLKMEIIREEEEDKNGKDKLNSSKIYTGREFSVTTIMTWLLECITVLCIEYIN